jgi:hypothetical protein
MQKYEGGVFGYTKTMQGTLTFDDGNNRLIFKDKKPPKEISIPYGPSPRLSQIRKRCSRRRTPWPATCRRSTHYRRDFIKHKVRYLTLQYSDPTRTFPESRASKSGQGLLESVLVTLARRPT